MLILSCDVMHRSFVSCQSRFGALSDAFAVASLAGTITLDGWSNVHRWESDKDQFMFISQNLRRLKIS
jgi:hypothetical protein